MVSYSTRRPTRPSSWFVLANAVTWTGLLIGGLALASAKGLPRWLWPLGTLPAWVFYIVIRSGRPIRSLWVALALVSYFCLIVALWEQAPEPWKETVIRMGLNVIAVGHEHHHVPSDASPESNGSGAAVVSESGNANE
jgi:hypothetical protein